MALEGTLKDFALPDIFQLIGLQKKTGTLFLKDESDEVRITFKDGSLVFADSQNKRLEERLGTMLVRSGLITEGQLLDILEKQKQTLQRLGVLLVNEGVVKQDDLRKALELQVTQIIYRVFRWEDAYYRFDQEDQIDYDRENVTPIGAESILMEGMRIIDEWPIIEKVVRSMSTVYEKVAVDQPIEIEGAQEIEDDDDFDFDLSGGGGSKEEGGDDDKITLARDEGAVYEVLDGERTLEDVMYLARLSEFDTCKAAYDLLSRDLIRERREAGEGSEDAPAQLVAAAPAEAHPAVVAGLHVLLALLVVAGAAFWQANPLMGGSVLGLREPDVERQLEASIGTRLDRVAYLLEVHRLATQDDTYPADLEELVDLGYLRPVDIETPAGQPFEYQRSPDGRGFELVAVGEDGAPLGERLRRSVGEEG